MRPDRRSHDATHSGATAPFAAHWGQIEAWSNFSEIGPAERHLVVRGFPLAAPAPESAVRRAIGTLVARHEGLRTIIVPAGDENLAATTLTDPEPDVCLVSEDDDTGIPPQFSDPPFDPTDRMPIRFGLRRAGTAVDAVTCGAVHTAVDVWAMRILESELHTALADPDALADPANAGMSPSDLARHERSEQMRRRREHTAAYWRFVLDSTPGTVFPRVAHPPEVPRYRQLMLTSTALLNATTWLARTYRVPLSTVALAAYAFALQLHAGTRVLPVCVVVNNRFDRRVRNTVASLTQVGVIAADSRDLDTFGSFVDRTASALMRCGQHSHYDPYAIRRLEHEILGRRPFRRMFNCLTGDLSPHAWWADRRLTTSDLATEETSVVELATPPDGVQEQYLQVHRHEKALVLRLRANEAHLPPALVAAVLRTVERIAVTAAADPEVSLRSLAQSAAI